MLSLNSEDILTYLVRGFIIFLILPLHEYAHAWTAKKLGDDTAEYEGRLTLNPIAHIDPFGALLLLFTGFGWAKPVPVNPLRFKHKVTMRGGMALTAAAGPISNLLAALVGTVIFRIWEGLTIIGDFASAYSGIVTMLLMDFVMINVGLAVFNLIPVPPLDGSKVLFYFLGSKGDKLVNWLNRNYTVVRLAFLVVMFSGILSVPLLYVESYIMRGMMFITNWIPALFR